MEHESFNYRGTYDENLPLPAILTLAQYRRVFFRPDAHFVDGEILPRHLGDALHSHTVGAILLQIDPAAGQIGADTCISLRLQVSPNRIRVCDLVALAPYAPHEQVPTVAPLLCIEVLGKGDDPSFEFDTLADYRAMGVPNIWLIDPIRRTAYTFGVDGTQIVSGTQLIVPGTDILLDLPTLFAQLDAAIARRGKS